MVEYSYVETQTINEAIVQIINRIKQCVCMKQMNECVGTKKISETVKRKKS